MLATASPRPWPTDGSPSTRSLTSADPSKTPGRHGSTLGSNLAHGLPPEFSPRHTSHRRSLQPPGVRRPLRSSPLAGPALQLDGPIPEAEEENSRPSRTTSNPDLTSLLTPPPPVRRARPKTAGSLQGFSQLSTSSLPTTLKRPPSCTFSLGGLSQKGSRESIQSVSRQPTVDLSNPPSTLRHPPNMAESLRTGKPVPRPASVMQRPKSTHGYPSLSQIIPDPDRPLPEHLPRTHSRDPADNSWFTANPYETTPRFSRLGLGSSNVVLPVSAKEHKRLSHQNSKSSVKTSATRATRTDSVPSSPDISPTSSQQDTLSLPNSSLTRCNSSNPSSESLPLSTPRRRTVSSITTTTSNIITITEGEESEYRRNPHSEPNHLHHNQTIPAIAPKKGPLARLKNLGLRSIRSPNSLTSARLTPISEKLMVDASQPDDEIKLGLFTPRSESSMSGSTDESKADGAMFGVPSTLSKRVYSVKRIWKSITGRQGRS